MKKIGKRVAAALEVLINGGYFSESLEPAGRWRTQLKFRTRLRTSTGQMVPGVGFATRHELEQKGVIEKMPGVATWRLKEGA